MINLVRSIVGGPKNRLIQGEYNLDLTYVTPRIIAMAFPASGIEQLYRNSIDTVAKFLEQKHKNHYITINLSGRKVDETKLQNVKNFAWEDHKAPSLELLFIICEIIGIYLQDSPHGVVVINCNHGKGRTGTIICCFLLYVNLFSLPIEAINFYGRKRFQEMGYGVTQPCQIKYIQYFTQMLKNSQLKTQIVCVRQIIIKGSHKMSQPYIRIKNISTDTYILTTMKNPSVLIRQKQNQFTSWRIKDHVYLAGDILIQLKDQSKIIGDQPVGSFTFNTIFIYNDQPVVVPLKQISPISAIKSGAFGQDFQLQIHFQPLRRNKPIQINIESLKTQQNKISQIKASLKYRQRLKGKTQQILLGSQTTINQFLKESNFCKNQGIKAYQN